MTTINIGDTVISQPIGSKESFTGTVVATVRDGYTIRDAFNLKWHRSEEDLTIVRKA
jgi:hypothetical protein